MKKILIILLTILILSCQKEPEIKQEKDLFFKQGINKLDSPAKAPNFTLKDLNGNDISLSDYKGSVVVLNFWAYWCGPCKIEMPSIENLNKLTKELDIKVVTINLGESLEVVSKYYNENNFTFVSLLDTNKTVGSSYGIRSIPSTYIINKDGYILGGKLGAHEWDSQEMIKLLEELL